MFHPIGLDYGEFKKYIFLCDARQLLYYFKIGCRTLSLIFEKRGKNSSQEQF